MKLAVLAAVLLLVYAAAAQEAGVAQQAAPAPNAATARVEAPAPEALTNQAFPGQSLRPVKGVNYAVTPSDFTSYNQGGIYPATGGDFENSKFAALWGPTGRNDLADIASLKANAIRSYEYKGYYSHTSFLDAAHSSGLQAIVPLSNAEILAASSSTYISATIKEAVNHPANMAWGLSNELTYDGSCQPLSKCFPKLIAAAQQINQMDPSSRPIIVTSIFDANFATTVSVRQAFISAGLRTLYNARVVQGVNMYFSENSSQLSAILGNILKAFYSNASLQNSSLIVTEYGRQSGSPFSITEQANAVAAETSTLLGFARGTQYPRFLGFFCFQYADSNLNGGSTFGLKAYGSSSTEVNGPGGAYKVDTLVNKPAYNSFKQALAS